MSVPRSSLPPALLALSLVAAASSTASADPGPTPIIPASLASRLAGCWQLGPYYRVVFRTDGAAGLRVSQRTRVVGSVRTRDEVVRYDPSARVVGFGAITWHHTSVVRLWWTGGALHYVFSYQRSPSLPWIDRLPGVASRCA